MGFFKKISGKQKQDDTGETMPIYYANNEEDYMDKAFKRARETFGYFWRELYWEYRRIVPALDVACVKICFTDEIGGKEIGEHMWVNDVNFDGEYITGVLINDPNDVKNVENGDMVSVRLDALSDWMFVINNKTYGGFSVQAMRSKMDKKERAEHDKAWGFDFGDFNDILVAYEQKEHPENLTEHPMSKNMAGEVEKYIASNPSIITDADNEGYTQLHHEAIAGNLSIVKVLLKHGADKNAKTKSSKSAVDFAKAMNWKHIAEFLER